MSLSELIRAAKFDFVAWLRSLVRKPAVAPLQALVPELPESQPQPIAVEQQQPEPEPVINHPPFTPAVPQLKQANKPKRTPRKTFVDILENLDETFKNLRRDVASTDVLMALSPSDKRGLRRIGPLVFGSGTAASAFKQEVSEFPTDDAMLPATFMLALNDGGNADDKWMYPDFAFGIKIRKPPWIVVKQRGQAWIFGMAWRTSAGKLAWGHFYAYTDSGKVVPSQWLCEKPVAVGGGSYTKRSWEACSWVHGDNAKSAVIRCMSASLALYARRTEFWSASVSSGSDRATFLIDPKDTTIAFRDRGATAIAADGKRKRIIHLVREHTQDRGEGNIVRIPSHIRGLREFDWHGYHCFVTSPNHHSFHLGSFQLAADDAPDDGNIPKTHITLDTLADKLVGLEESGNTKRKRA